MVYGCKDHSIIGIHPPLPSLLVSNLEKAKDRYEPAVTKIGRKRYPSLLFSPSIAW
jgi:hypothetical protein